MGNFTCFVPNSRNCKKFREVLALELAGKFGGNLFQNTKKKQHHCRRVKTTQNLRYDVFSIEEPSQNPSIRPTFACTCDPMPVTVSTWTFPISRNSQYKLPPPLIPRMNIKAIEIAELLARNHTGNWIFYGMMCGHYFFMMHDLKGNFNTFTVRKYSSHVGGCVMERNGENVPNDIKLGLPIVVRDLFRRKAATTTTLYAVLHGKY